MAVQIHELRPVETFAEREAVLVGEPGPLPNILVVDDENGPRQALRVLLNEDYQVHLVEDVDSALEVLNTEEIELVITDVRMPKKTGVDLLREAKRIFPDLQIIVLTGYGQLETAVKAVEYGAFSYMEKPFDNDAMLDMVRAGIEKFREERDRRALEFLALEANRFDTVGRVVSGMMHDLGSPLTVLSSQIDLLEMTGGKDDATQRLSVMRDQVDHCGELVRSTMDFMRNESKANAEYQINDVINACLRVATPQLRDYHANTALELADNLPAISGQIVEMRQAILNLVMNACHAQEGQDEERTVRIKSWLDDDHVAVAVADNGPGIPESAASKIFDTFYSTKGDKGTGLGLSVVRNVMRNHGGSVRLESNASVKGSLRGACFVLRFPVEE